MRTTPVLSLLFLLAFLAAGAEQRHDVSLTVNSPLAGCRVRINGKDVGVTPLVLDVSGASVELEVFTPDGGFSLRATVKLGPERRLVALADFGSGRIILYRTPAEIMQYVERQSRIADFRLRYTKALELRKKRRPAEALAMLEAALASYDEPSLHPLLVKWRKGALPKGFAYIRGGTFRMGQERAEYEGDELQMPAHDVCVSDFAIMKTEVTNALFARFVEETGYVTTAETVGSAFEFDRRARVWRLLPGASWRSPRGKRGRLCSSFPVSQVSWKDCAAFAEWYARDLGVPYGTVRLPTEAEWELAARGLDGRPYPWGDTSPFDDRSLAQVGASRPNVVALKKGHSPEGVYDLIGNVWEWCFDVADPDYYRLCKEKGIVLDPMGPLAGELRVVRGGGYDSDAKEARPTVRRFMPACKMAPDVGFRLVIAFRFKLCSGK